MDISPYKRVGWETWQRNNSCLPNKNFSDIKKNKSEMSKKRKVSQLFLRR